MSEEWYYDVTTGTASKGKVANSLNRMGPYPDEATALRALEIAAARNAAAADDEDD
ncbi:MAG: hypothetical protein QM809_00345 [Gordonia sp. (in: high G+C Gram-positive bacteria)]|uniref:hypothetical protein n=1 Tax=Gordonia sp. (in: high G+C Gram-positive bacteria) TaxID=84139 RepID=UPI0039E40993